MFFDIAWPELLLIGLVALVVIGPKDLPAALRVAGFWFRKARTLSREFQSSVEQMMREAELDEMRKQLQKATEFDVEKEFQKTVDPTGELARGIQPPSDVPDYLDAPPKSETLAAAPTALPALEEQPELPFAGPEAVRAAEATPASPNLASPDLALPDPAAAPEAPRESAPPRS